jgi:uncharacterized protein YqeY
MSLKEEILNDFKEAFKNKDLVAKNTLSMLKSEIANAEIDLGHRDEGLPDDEVVKVIKKLVKQRKDSIEQFEKGGNSEMAENEKAELVVLEKYLPEQMSAEEIEAKVKEVIEKVGATGAGDLGKVMGAVMGELGAEADGNTVREIAGKLLS